MNKSNELQKILDELNEVLSSAGHDDIEWVAEYRPRQGWYAYALAEGYEDVYLGKRFSIAQQECRDMVILAIASM